MMFTGTDKVQTHEKIIRRSNQDNRAQTKTFSIKGTKTFSRGPKLLERSAERLKVER